MMNPLKSALFYRKMDEAGISQEKLLETMRRVLGEVNEDPADYILVAPILVVHKDFKEHPLSAHGLLVEFGQNVYFMSKARLIDAVAAVKDEPLIVKN